MRLSPYPVEPDAISGEDSIRTELNCRIPSWCCREWLGVEKDLHMSGGEQCQMQRALYKDTKETYWKERHSREELGVSPYGKVEN